jgi:adenylosuccinate lyase
MRDWLNAYVPERDNGEAPGSSEGRATNSLFAAEAIDTSFDTAYHLKHVDTIFRRVFGE